LDACLGVPGLPQSATGHTTIYTGRNGPKVIGRHLYGFPNAALRKLLQLHGIFLSLQQKNIHCKFINAFRPVFFTTPEIFQNLNLSATTEMNRFAGLPFSTLRMIRENEALYHDYTNKELVEKSFKLPLFSAEKAAEVLVHESQKNQLILYEYFLTDFAGHSRHMEQAISEIRKVEQLIEALLNKINFSDTFLIIVSDHGNIEDLRTKSHTLNPAFMAIWKPESVHKLPDFLSLMDIHPFLYSVLIPDRKNV
jgi:2,3-bisphosphoglycerate-independent phosphoglycerate mutase